MTRTTFALGLSVAAVAVTAQRDAAACGGCFHPPTQTASDITDERMLLSVSTTQTTLYDQINFAGSPTSFAWVLPIQGTVTVGLSADVLFDSIDVLTATQIVAPPLNCPSPSCPAPPLAYAAGAALAPDAGSAAEDTVIVTKQETVGPYATVQLHATDSSALSAWLAQNGYNIPAAVAPVINAYVAEGFDFLAMKLLPNEGVQSMRPVRVTSAGASLSLPLRMASVGTGPIVGITIWVVSDGRYEPQNFPFFHIDDSALVWDWSTDLSNYTTLRVENEAALANKGWEIESSLTLNQQTITNTILSGGQYVPGRSFGGTFTPADPSADYLPATDPNDGGVTQTADQVRTADIAALFAGLTAPNARVTRIRSDIAQTAMTQDLVMQASADQSELSNVRQVTNSVNETCPIYSGCQVVGSGTLAQAQASVAGANGSGGLDAGFDATTGTTTTATATAVGTGSASSSTGQPRHGVGTSASSTPSTSSATGTSTSTGPGGADASAPTAGAGAPASSTTSGGCSASAASNAGGGAAGLAAIAAALALAGARRGRRRSAGAR
jgi:hypothetical protein